MPSRRPSHDPDTPEPAASSPTVRLTPEEVRRLRREAYRDLEIAEANWQADPPSWYRQPVPPLPQLPDDLKDLE